MTRDRDEQIRRNLQAILEAATDLLFEVEVPETGDDLANADRLHQIAFTECIRRAGEAVAQIDSLDATWLTKNFPGIPWQAMKSTRNRLTHPYWNADYQILHDIAVEHLPVVTGPVATYLSVQDPYRLLDPSQIAADAITKQRRPDGAAANIANRPVPGATHRWQPMQESPPTRSHLSGAQLDRTQQVDLSR